MLHLWPLIFLVFLLFQIDDELSPGAEQWLTLAQEKYSQPQHSEAYIYLLGMMANELDAPALVGRQRYLAYKQAEDKLNSAFDVIEYDDYPQDKRLVLPDNDEYCDLYKPECFEQLSTSAINTERLKQHDLLQQRYLHFIALNDFQTLYKPYLNAEFPSYHALKIGHFFWMKQLLNQFQAAADAALMNQQAAQALEQNIKHLRLHLKQADTLIHKTIISRLLVSDLSLYEYLLKQNLIAESFQLEPLTKSELSFDMALQYEFMMAYYLSRGLDKHPQFFETNDIAEGEDKNEEKTRYNPFLPYYVRAMFKPNMSINKHYAFLQKELKRYETAIENNTTPGSVMCKKPENLSVPSHEQTEPEQQEQIQATGYQWGKRAKFSVALLSSLRNLAGNILMSVGHPDFGDYFSDLQKLKAQVDKINALTAN